MSSDWNADRVLETAREFQSASILVAAAELDLIRSLAANAMNAEELAELLGTDGRATAMLADALVAMELLEKEGDAYCVAPDIASLFDETSDGNVVAMLRHQANCLRSWAQLASVVRRGTRYDRPPSVRGTDEDRRSFIEAMEVASRDAAPRVVASLGKLPFGCVLDIGGGPGTWTRAFLDHNPAMRAILYDLPEVLPLAHAHLEKHALLDRVLLKPGDFYLDQSLPQGADLAWVSAITHQNSREQNRELYQKVYQALAPEGRILIRDIVMSGDHVAPRSGAMFAINMLVNTEAGGTYSVDEQQEDLEAAGFTGLEIREAERDMDWILQADKS